MAAAALRAWPAMRRHISLTAVEYDDEDVLSELLAWLSLIPQAVVVAMATATVTSEGRGRRCQMASLLAGQLANEAINYVAKFAAQEPRPDGTIASPRADCSSGPPPSPM